ncbi:ABC transporter permease [Fimbriimonas ginsengisoli]|uniref:ABC transporter permease n=1 Tax=Fimbriimonas ginsengisoli TaxID=1005039 RepID=UPI0005716C92|nr:ABC transporter permease [Fimbriimonas ginsengisoli]
MPRTRARAILRPLAPSTYLLRNAGKTIPLTSVIMLAVMLVSSIISMIDSIPYSIRVIYAYSKEMVGITPRGDTSQTPKLLDDVRKHSPVPLDRIVTCRASGSQVKSIVGKWPFIMLGLSQPDMQYYLKRQGMTALVGRLPKPGAPEAVVSRPVAKNLNLKIGSAVQGPDMNESYSPKWVKVVGIAETDRWVMVNSLEYQRAYHYPPIDLGMAFAKNLQDQDKLDHWADKYFKGQHGQIWAYFQIEKQTKEMFTVLFKILNVVIATLALVITFMMGMLMNIYQSQRLVEFGLLQAIGYTKRQLLKRVLLEAIAVIVMGWILGNGMAYLLLVMAKKLLMDPSAFALQVWDPLAFQYTIPIPFAILIVAIGTVVLRFRRFDPVGVVERRLV